MSTKVGRLEALLGLDQRGLAVGLKEAENSMRQAGKRMQSVGRGMSMAISLPLAIIGGAVIKTFAEFESGMKQVKAITGATNAEMGDLIATARHLGAITKFTAVEVAQGMNFLAMTGFSVNEVIGSMPSVLSLATAGAMELGRAADIVSNIMRGFGLESKDMTETADILTAVFTNANTNLEQLGTAMGFAAPIMKAFGQDVTTAAVMIGILGDAGVQGTRAGTALRQMWTQLIKKQDKLGISITGINGEFLNMADVIEELEKTGLSTAEVFKIVGPRAGLGMAIAMDRGSRSIRQFIMEADNMGGIADKIAKTQLEGLKGAFVEMKAALSDLAIAIGTRIGPMLEAFIDWVKRTAKWMALVDTNTIKAGVALGLFAAAAGPVLLILGGIFAIFGIMAFKILAVVAALAILAAGFIYVTKNWDAIKERLTDLTWWRNTMITMAQHLIKWMTFAFSWLIKEWNWLFEQIGKLPGIINVEQFMIPDPFEAAIDGLEELKDKTKEYKNQFQTFGEFMKDVGKDVKNILAGMIPDFFSPGVENVPIKDEEKPFNLRPRSKAGSPRLGAPGATGGAAGAPANNVKIATRAIEGSKEAVFELGDAMQSVLNDSFTEFGETLGNLFSGDSGATSFFEGLLTIVASFMKTFGKALIAAGVAALAFKELVISPIGAIAAGIALVAAAGLVTAILKKGPGNIQGMKTGGFVEQGGLFKLHKNETLALPAGTAVTPARSSAGGSLSTNIRMRSLIIELDRERERMGN